MSERPQESRLKKFIKSRLLLRPPVEEDPYLLPGRVKTVAVLTAGITAASAPFASTIYFPGMAIITAEMQCASIVTTLTASLFVLFMGITPIFWASISDYYGIRRILLLASMVIFAGASIGCALVKNIAGLIVLRCLQSVGASCGTSIGAGVIADCFPIEKRGSAFAKFFFALFAGPLLGPLLGGVLIMSPLSWRTVFWFCVAFAGAVFLLIFFFFPETYRDTAKFDVSLTPAKVVGGDASEQEEETRTVTSVAVPVDPSKNEKNVGNAVYPLPKRKPSLNVIEPFLLLRHPFVLLAAVSGGINFGCMFAIQPILSTHMVLQYHFPTWKTGLCFLGGGIGIFFGTVLTNIFSDRVLMNARAKRGGAARSEDRLWFIVWPSGFILMPFGLLLFGWFIERNKSVWGAIFGFAITGFSMNQVMTSHSSYLVDSLPGKGASVTAAANLVRMVFACILSLVADPMDQNIGPGYMGVMFAALSVVSTGMLVILKIYGPQLRKFSGY